MNQNQNLVKVEDGKVVADSRTIAELFEKQHKNVLRDIRNLNCSADFKRLNFELNKNKDLTGEFVESVEMTRDGFTFLVMGFNGEKAAKWKEAYINAFNDMEAQLRKRFEVPQTYPEALRLAAEESERADKAEAALEEAKPKVDFYEQFCEADGLYTLQNAGRALNLKPNLFIRWLKTQYIFYQGKALVPYIRYRHQGIFDVINTIIDDKARPQTFITPKGLEYFSGHAPDNLRIKKAA